MQRRYFTWVVQLDSKGGTLGSDPLENHRTGLLCRMARQGLLRHNVTRYKYSWYPTQASWPTRSYYGCTKSFSNKHVLNRAQGPVVRKSINANPRLKVNRGFNFSCKKVFFTAKGLQSLRLLKVKTEGQKISTENLIENGYKTEINIQANPLNNRPLNNRALASNFFLITCPTNPNI